MKIRLGEKTTQVVSRVNKINGWQNRAAYGVSALISQPFFDFKNPSVDSTTQKYSLVKTLVKIAVGTAVGIAFRVPFQKLGENLYKKGAFNKQKPLIKNMDEEKFKVAVGNVFSIIGAVVGILSVDILISNKLLSYFNKKLQKKEVKQ